MVVKSVCSCAIGLVCFSILCGFECLAFSMLHYDKRSTNNDEPAQKHTQFHHNKSATSSDGDVAMAKITTPSWMDEMLGGKWYGAEYYMKRELYMKDPKKRPTVCYSNTTKDQNGTLLNHFICPRSNQRDEYTFCCGDKFNQHCCTEDESNSEKDDDIPLIEDIDIVTGISIGVGFVLSVCFCMGLYCCCCQRRPEIHDGIKLMWVRRSFGKELNRLEEPMYQNRLQVGAGSSKMGSRSGSRNPSRGGSPHPSRKGSRNPSRNPSIECSPSISRRGSHHTSHKHKDEGSKEKLKVPGGVTITLTTPSDEQGPTNPLLKQTQETINST